MAVFRLTVKEALIAPCGKATPEGTIRAGLLLVSVTKTPEVGFDRFTVQEAFVPAVSLVGVQVTDDKAGGDDSVRLVD